MHQPSHHPGSAPARVLYRWGIIWTILACGDAAFAQQMIFPRESWQMATPESVLVDSAKLESAIATLDTIAASVEEMVIARNGRVIWQGSRPDYTQHVYSMTKSFASTAMGLLVDDGKITIDTPVKDFVPALADQYPNATFRHFATHTSGYLAEGERVPLPIGSQPPADPFAPAAPLFEPPGSSFAYTVTAMDMWANGLTRAAGESLEDLFNRRIAGPIGMNPDEFQWRGFTAPDGTFIAGGSGFDDRAVVISANNAARFGHLYLNDGNWDGEQLLSREWVEEATQVQVPSTVPVDPGSASPTAGPGQYGLGWWVDPVWQEAIGYPSNYTSVSPSTGFVMARMGTETGNDGIANFQGALLRAVIPAVWDELGDGRWDEFDELSGKPRWKTESGMVPDIYPTHQAIVRTNAVTVDSRLDIGTVTIESGQLHVAESGILHSGEHIRVESNARFTTDGSVEANRLTINGNMVVDGPLSVGLLTVSEGELDLHDNPGPFEVTARLSLANDAKLRFHISDDSWDSPCQFLGNRASASLNGDLVLEISETFNPEALEGKTLKLFDWSERLPTSTFNRIVVPSRINWDASQLYTTGEIVVVSVLDKPTQPGDFDGNSLLDVADIDALSKRIAVNSTDAYYDLDDDGVVTHNDLDRWVHDLKQTYFGDANLDGEFNSSDFTLVFLAGEYEDAVEDNSGWAEGDWDGDGDFTSQDMVKAFLDGGYETGPRAAGAVPEPTGCVLLAIGALACGLHRHRRVAFPSPNR